MLGITLSRQDVAPLKRQLYAQLKDAVAGGRLKAGDAVPSTRELSRDLGVSRNTVGEAYDMLIAEGYLLSRQGAPTRVAKGLRLETPETAAPEFVRPIRSAAVSFRTGRPDLRQFPKSQWLQAMRRSAERLPAEDFNYTGPQGLGTLREELAGWLYRSRGLAAAARDIFITAGATHALSLACDTLDLGHRRVLMEDPCHSGMLETFRARRCEIIPVPADDHGLQTDGLRGLSDIAAVYVTPSHQFPLGGILSAPRRAALIRFARETGAYIIEDDYDSEFRYTGTPVSPLVDADPQSVIYVGTLSKALFPALRIGYAVVPRPLQQRWRYLRTHGDVQNPVFEQAALSEFMAARRLDGHIRRMRKLYGERRAVLLEALSAVFPGTAAVGDAAGLHVAVDFPGMVFGDAFRARCLRSGIDVTPVETHCIKKGRHESKLLMGYGHLEPDELRAGVLALRAVMEAEGDNKENAR